MSVEFRSGDILSSDAEAIVVTVNCVGVMGKGLALQAKQKWPRFYRLYWDYCRMRPQMFYPGEVYDWQILPTPTHTPYYVIGLATKDHWKDPSQLDWIKGGLRNLVDSCTNNRIQSVAIPPLGCGLGGLDWTVVRPLIVAAFDGLPVRCLIYGRER